MTISQSIVISDNGFGTLASSLAVGDTTLAFTTGHGARFPTVVSGQVLYLCLLNTSNVLEEVQVTAHAAASDSATIVRAANGTTAKAWNTGDRVEARISSEVLERLQTESNKSTTITTADSGVTYTGSMANAALGYVSAMIYIFTLATSNSVVAPTIAIDSLSAITVVQNGGAALQIGQLPTTGMYLFDGTNFIILNPLGLAGAMVDFAGTSAPGGYLLCDGSAVDRTTYARLFSAISTTWGVGNGTTTFNVPNFQRRVSVGSGGSATATLSNTAGSTGGEETHALIASELTAYNTNITVRNSSGDGASSSGVRVHMLNTPSDTLDVGASANTDFNQGFVTNPSVSAAHNNIQPSAVVTKIIRY